MQISGRSPGPLLRRAGIHVTLAAVLMVVAVLVGWRSGPSSADLSDPMHMEMPTDAAFVEDAATLQPEGWTATASSALPGHSATAVLDGRTKSYWQSAPSRVSWLTLDLRAPEEIAGLSYTPRSGTSPHDSITRFEVQVSSTGVTWRAPISTGTWAATPGVKSVGFTAVTARFVRLTALSSTAAATVAAAAVTLTGPLRPGVVSHDLTGDAAALSSNPAQVGQWGATYGFPFVPTAAVTLPGNRLLLWSSDQDWDYAADNAANYTETAILDLTTGEVSPELVTNTDHNMFCPGIAILANGEIMVTGGDSDDKTSIYNPATGNWVAGPPMNIGRGYQGMTLLSNEQAFTLGGSWSGPTVEKVGEVWSATGGWRLLPSVPATPMYTQDPQGPFRADNHGWFIATSGGRVLQAGPSKQMNWITTSGAGSITPAGNRSTMDQMNGNAVYYTTNKVLTLGGAPDYQDSYATNASYTINLAGTTPIVTRVGNLNDARTFANSVVLPTGQVVVMGGEDYGVPFSDDTSVLNAELWNPGTGKYTLMAAEAEPRNYHSVAVLLPDGRIFSGGGGLCGEGCATNHPDGQIYSPPYLFNADGTLANRPTIVSAPTQTSTGKSITVTTGGQVTSFSMVRDSESTHSVDNDQRRIPLTITHRSGDSYTLAVPADPGVALPGPYMLFAIARGVPSVSTSLMVTTPSAPGPVSAYGKQLVKDGVGIYWPLGDAGGTAASDLSGNTDTGVYTASGVAFGSASPVESANGMGITLDGQQGELVASQEQTDPTAYTESMWFSTTTATGGDLMGFGAAQSGLSAQDDRLVWMDNAGHLVFATAGASGSPEVITSPQTYNGGGWHQVVATQGPVGMRLYVDGSLVAKSTNPASADFAGFWHVGAENLASWPDAPTSNYLSATVSDVGFFNTALTAGQVGVLHKEAG